jgi:chromosome segregation ATPase
VEHLAAKLDATSTSLRAALSASAAEQTLALTAHQAASAKALLSVQEDLVNKIQQQGVQLQGLKDQSTKSTSAASVKAESAQAAADRLSALVRALEASHEETGGAVKGLVKDTERLETQVAALKLGRSEIDDELRKLTASKDSQGASMLDIVTRLGALERAVTAAASEKSRLAPLLQQQPQDAPVKGGSEGLSAESHQQHHHLKAAVSAAVSAATASVAAQVAAMATSMEAMQARLRVVETRGPAHEALDTLIHRVGQLEQSKAGGVPSGYGQPGSLSAMPSTANLEAQAAEVAAATQKADSAAALALAESAEIRAVQEALTSKVATLEATLKQLSEKVAGASASVAASAYTTPALSTRPSLGIPPASDKGAEELQSHLLALDRRLEEATQQLQRRITDAEADAGRAMQKLKAMLAPALAANQRVDQVETSVKGLTDQVAQLQQAAQSAGDGAAVAQAALEAAAAAKAAASKVEDQALGWGVQLQELAEKLAHLQSNAAAVAPSARSTYTGDAAGGEAGTLHSPPHVHQSAHSVSSVASSALVHPSELSFAQGMGVQQRPGTASGGLAGIDSASLPPPGVASRVTALETEVNAKLPRIEAQLAEALPLLAKLPRVEIDVGELSLAISKAPAEAAQALSKVTALESELAAKLPQVEAQLTHAQQLLGRMPQLESLVAELQAALNRSTSAAAEAGSRDNGLVKEHKAETASQPATAASEAQLNSRLNQLESQLMSKLPQLESQVTSRLPELEAQLESLLPQLQSQLTQAEAQSSDVSSKLVQLGSQLASQQKLIARLPDLETALGTLQASAEKVLALDERLSKLAASSEAIEAALSSKVAALQVQLSQLAAATAEASATAEAASASAQEALTAWQSKAPGGASKAGSKVAASSSVASSSQAGGKSSAGGGAGESISSLPSAVHDVGKAALQARMSDVEERLGELTQRERADMEAIQSQLAAVQQSPRMDPEAVDRMQALERDLVKVNTVLVNLVSKVEEMQQQQAGGHAGLPADWGAALSEAQAKV